jgi:hypothetical protein
MGPLRIAGQGLFAGQEIKQGAKIIRYIGAKITHEESERCLAVGNVYIFGLDERYAIDGSTPKNTTRYSNHSCDLNCRKTGGYLRALYLKEGFQELYLPMPDFGVPTTETAYPPPMDTGNQRAT